MPILRLVSRRDRVSETPAPKNVEDRDQGITGDRGRDGRPVRQDQPEVGNVMDRYRTPNKAGLREEEAEEKKLTRARKPIFLDSCRSILEDETTSASRRAHHDRFQIGMTMSFAGIRHSLRQ